MSLPVTPKYRSRKCSVISQDFDYKNYELPPKVLFNFKTKRPKSSRLTRPITKFPHKQGDSRVGPGTYNPFTDQSSNFFHFSRVERFSTSVVDSSFIVKTHKSRQKTGKKSISSPKVTKSQENPLKPLENSLKKATFRAELAKIVKKNLLDSKIESQSEATKEKFRRLDFRLRIQEIAVIKKAWIVFEAVFSMTTWTMCKVKYLKGLRWRSRRLFRVFQFLVRFVAKFLRIHVRLKYYKGLRVRFKQIIRIYLSSYVKLWLSQRKKRLRKIIARVVEGASASQVFLKLIQSWKNKFEFIKRVLNGAVFYKVALYRSLMQRWNKAEYEMNNESPSKSMRRHRRALTVHALKDNSGLEGVLMIPVEVKLFYLRKFIKEKMIGYIKKYRKFKIEFKNIHRRNKKNRWILENNIMFDYPSPPDKVNIYEEFDMDKMKSIIQYVVSDKSNWNHIIYGHEGRASKNYHRRISRLQPNGFI